MSVGAYIPTYHPPPTVGILVCQGNHRIAVPTPFGDGCFSCHRFVDDDDDIFLLPKGIWKKEMSKCRPRFRSRSRG